MSACVAQGANASNDLTTALVDAGGEKKLAKRWRTDVVTRTRTSIESGAANEDVTCTNESGGSGGGAGLRFPQLPRHHFTNQEFSTAVRLRMNMKVYSSDQQCRHKSRRDGRVCTVLSDAKGLHPLLCKLGGHIDVRHNGGRDCLADLVSARVGSTVNVEQHVPDTLPDLRRPDVDFWDEGQRHVHLDFEVCTPHGRTASATRAPPRAGSLIETAEGVKRRKYRELLLIPIVCSHLGRFGKGAQSLFRMISRHEDASLRSRSIDECYQSMACEVQKGNVRILAAAGTLI